MAKPEYVKAAEAYRDDPKVEFVAVDCTKHAAVCSAYEVRGYPTIKYFSYLKTHKEYKGERKAEDFIKFMRNPDVEIEKPKEDVVPFTSEKVLLLSDKNFDATLKKAKYSLVMFFTNWCGEYPCSFNPTSVFNSKRFLKRTLQAVETRLQRGSRTHARTGC